MKYGVNAFIWTAAFESQHLPLLPRIKEAGFDGVEFPILQPAETPSAEIRRGLEANSLQGTTCAVMPAGVSIFDTDAAVRAKAFHHVKTCIETTAALGAQVCVGPLYSPVGWLPGRRRTDDEFNRAAEFLHSLGPLLETNGVKLAVEPLNRFETFFLNTVADAIALIDLAATPNVGILFDTFHANIEELDPAAALRSAAHRVFHVHTCENDRGTPGTGHVPWTEVFAALRDIHYDGWLTIESFGYNIPEMAAAAAIWRDLAPKPESIAFDGLPFLKRMASAS